MKTVLLVGLIGLGISVESYGIGRPHNLFAARKAILERRAATAANRQGLPVEVKLFQNWYGLSRYSYIFSPRLSQMPQARE